MHYSFEKKCTPLAVVLFSSLAYGQTTFKNVTTEAGIQHDSRSMKECLAAVPVFLISIRMDLKTFISLVERTTIAFI